MHILNEDLNTVKGQYKEQQELLKQKDMKVTELVKLTKEATNYAETLKGQVKDKDEQISFLIKQIDVTKRQLSFAQKKIKSLTGNVILELTKQLEGKIKEVEMVKEMLKSSKIELGGKEREIKLLRMKLAGLSKNISKSKPRGMRKNSPKPLIKSFANLDSRDMGKINANDIIYNSVPANNLFFNQNYGEAIKLPELGDMKELALEASIEKINGIADLNIPEVELLPELKLPSIIGSANN